MLRMGDGWGLGFEATNIEAGLLLNFGVKSVIISVNLWLNSHK